MSNPFVAAKAAAVRAMMLAKSAAMSAFQMGMAPRGEEFGAGAGRGPSYRKNSGRTVAQDKRDARKARNRAKHKRNA